MTKRSVQSHQLGGVQASWTACSASSKIWMHTPKSTRTSSREHSLVVLSPLSAVSLCFASSSQSLVRLLNLLPKSFGVAVYTHSAAMTAALYLRMTTISELSVDTSRGELMDINVGLLLDRMLCFSDIGSSLCPLQFDITFHKLPCAWTSLDAMDISGEMQLDVVRSLNPRHTSQGKPCLHMRAYRCFTVCATHSQTTVTQHGFVHAKPYCYSAQCFVGLAFI